MNTPTIEDMSEFIVDIEDLRVTVSTLFSTKHDAPSVKPERLDELVDAISQEIQGAKNLLDTIRKARNEIRVSMHPYKDYFTVNGSWGNHEWLTIETLIRSRDTLGLDELIVELKKIKREMEVKAKQKDPKKQAF